MHSVFFFTKHFVVRHKISFSWRWSENSDFCVEIGCIDNQSVTLVGRRWCHVRKAERPSWGCHEGLAALYQGRRWRPTVPLRECREAPAAKSRRPECVSRKQRGSCSFSISKKKKCGKLRKECTWMKWRSVALVSVRSLCLQWNKVYREIFSF